MAIRSAAQPQGFGDLRGDISSGVTLISSDRFSQAPIYFVLSARPCADPGGKGKER